MNIGRYENSNVDAKIRNIVATILGDGLFDNITRICERYSEEEDDFREYNVYKIRSANGIRILKRHLNAKLQIIQTICRNMVLRFLLSMEATKMKRIFGLL